ncbi:transglutaminase-like domain-containing protein [Actinoplanes sp. CA-252034]|uniref:transglutaminase-like domain-containing protein n=1 Tax=Actinoplanes sp. CA-252034 TaxID=3239906 RepID=UPI003D978DF5
MDYTRQTRFSDPGRHVGRLGALPGDVAGIGTAVRNLVVHYRASGLDFPPGRLAEIDSRWVEIMLGALPPGSPLDEPRPADQRIVGCCRDFTLLTVAALRHRGVPARSRVGFAGYLAGGFHVDHVVTEYHDGDRWIATDTQLDPAAGFPVDVADVPLGPGGLRTAAQCWLAFRRGEIDPEGYGVGPGVPIRGPLMIRKYVLTELAHRYGDETLLWDFWGSDAALIGDLGGRTLDEAWDDLPSWDSGDVTLIDEIAAGLVAADSGDTSAERRLAALYATDPRVRVGDTVTCHSPRGLRYDVDLRHPSTA